MWVFGIFLTAGIIWKGLNKMAQRVTAKELMEAVVDLSTALAMLAKHTEGLEQRLEKMEAGKQENSEAVSTKFVFGKGTTDGLSKRSI